MANLAVLLYEKVLNKPEGIPEFWPAEVQNLGESIRLPNSDWTLMTEQELVDHKAIYQQDYNAWEVEFNNSQDHMKSTDFYMEQVEQGMDFGRRLMIEFNAMNIQRSMNTTQVKYLAYSLQAIQGLLLNGSIYSAREEAMKLIPIEGILLPEDIDYFINKMDQFLYERDGYIG